MIASASPGLALYDSCAFVEVRLQRCPCLLRWGGRHQRAAEQRRRLRFLLRRDAGLKKQQASYNADESTHGISFPAGLSQPLELVKALRPDDEQRNAADDQSRRESPPEPGHADTDDEAQRISERQADEPVPGKVPEHRRPRVAKTSQHTGRHALKAVEHLEYGTNHQERRPDRNDVGICGERADEEPGNQQKCCRRARHETDAQRQRRPARTRGTVGIQSADRLPDAHRTRRRYAQRHHERERGDVDGNLMRGERRRRKAAGERRCRCKYADFKRDLRRRRRSQGEQPPHPRQLDRQRRLKESGTAPPLAMDDHREQIRRHGHARSNRRPRSTGHAECGRTELAEDQHPIEEHVGEVGHDERHHDRPHDAHSLQVAAERAVEQKRQDAPRHHIEVFARQSENSWMDAPAVEAGGNQPQDRP